MKNISCGNSFDEGVPKGLLLLGKFAASSSLASVVIRVSLASAKSLCGVVKLTIIIKSVTVITEPLLEIPPRFATVKTGLGT